MIRIDVKARKNCQADPDSLKVVRCRCGTTCSTQCCCDLEVNINSELHVVGNCLPRTPVQIHRHLPKHRGNPVGIAATGVNPGYLEGFDMFGGSYLQRVVSPSCEIGKCRGERPSLQHPEPTACSRSPAPFSTISLAKGRDTGLTRQPQFRCGAVHHSLLGLWVRAPDALQAS